MDELEGIVLDHLSNKLFAPERLGVLLEGFMAHQKDGADGRRKKLRQARDARGGLDASLGRLLALVESGSMQPDDPALRDRLVALRMQQAELGRDRPPSGQRADGTGDHYRRQAEGTLIADAAAPG